MGDHGDVGELVHYDVAGGIATITLDSPHNRNALSRQLVTELSGRLAAAEAAAEVRGVLLTHTGTTFCSGADLSEAAAHPLPQATAALLALLRSILALPKPVVAAVRGNVRAGGIGIVGACDLAVVTEGSSFAFTEVRLGLAAAVISLTVLPRMNDRAAAHWFLTGARFDGAEAVRSGLVTMAVPDDEAGAAVGSLLVDLAKGSPQGLAATKRLLTTERLGLLDERGPEMADMSAELFASDEARAYLLAFLEKKS